MVMKPNAKGLLHIGPGLYSGWGFHTSQRARIKLRALMAFQLHWRHHNFKNPTFEDDKNSQNMTNPTIVSPVKMEYG